jgi:hypothetical protein
MTSCGAPEEVTCSSADGEARAALGVLRRSAARCLKPAGRGSSQNRAEGRMRLAPLMGARTAESPRGRNPQPGAI